MAAHGWQKLTEIGPAMFGESMVADLGLPAPVAIGWAVTFIELIGGLLLVVGPLARISSLLLLVVLTGALLLVKLDTGLIAPMGAMLPGAELDLALIGGALGVLLLGPGRPSIDHALGIERGVPALAQRHVCGRDHAWRRARRRRLGDTYVMERTVRRAHERRDREEQRP